MWNKFRWLVERALDFKRKSYPLCTLGARLLLSNILVPVPSIVFAVRFPEGFVISGLEITQGGIGILSIALACILVAVGVGLITYELSKFARNTSRVLITGMPGLSPDFPNCLLSKSEERSSREPVELGLSDVTAGNLSDHIDRYNAELSVDLFKRFVIHHNCTKLYIGGLTRVPFLVAYGAFLRNISAKITYFDKLHQGGDWSLLNDVDTEVSFSEFILITTPNTNGDVGLAVGFSSEVLEEQLPEQLQGHTTILKPSIQGGRNLVKNQDNLERLGMQLKSLIDQLNGSDINRVHLFLSVQSTFAIEMGRHFQEGMHRNWVIHNFDAQSGKYVWAIELTRDGISEYQ